MTSHVVVIDSTARRALIKVSPGKHLSEVLEEACERLGATAANSGLKHNDKAVDLSRIFRLSGLSPGAKINLVQVSRSAAAVSVAIQLPESEGNTRLTDKFPNTTTLWLVLRKFESGIDGDRIMKRNLTARGAPSMSTGSSGAGRLYYQTPVIQVLGRELSSFEDLQKTLAQLGFNTGGALLRISFRTSETPLEEAMVRISEYFEPVGDLQMASGEEHQKNISEPPLSVINDQATAPGEVADTGVSESLITANPGSSADSLFPDQYTTLTDSPSQPSIQTVQPSSAGRPIQIFSPPNSSTPMAAQTAHNPADYVPTIEHATAHQRQLQGKSYNKRLLSEAELAEKSAAEAEKLKGFQEVEIKIRFPDQSSAVSTFGQAETGANLHSFVREDCLDARWREEKFLLSHSSTKGWNPIPNDPSKKLIQHLTLRGRVMVTFKWDESGGASMDALRTKDVLKPERKDEAQSWKPQQPAVGDHGEDKDAGTIVDLATKNEEPDEKKKKGIPKWLRLPGKK